MTPPRAQFRLWGFPVRVDPSFALVALFGLSAGSLEIGVAWVAIVFVTTLVHELGHAFAFRRYGRASSITLWGFGGFTQSEGPALDRGKSIAVSLAGPFAGMIVLGVPALLARAAFVPASPTAALIVKLLVLVSITWSAVNLLPVIPLDGGHVAANILEGLWGTVGAKAALWLSIAVAVAGGGFAFTQGYTFAAIYGAFFVMQNVSALAGLREAPHADLLQKGHRDLDAGHLDSALRTAQDVLARTRKDVIRAHAIDLSAWVHLAAGRRAEAARVLEDLPKENRQSRALLTCFLMIDGHRAAAVESAADALLEEGTPNLQLALTLERGELVTDVIERLTGRADEAGLRAARMLVAQLHQAGRFGASAAAGRQVFERGGPDQGLDAYNVACSLAQAGLPGDAISWLERAIGQDFEVAGRLDEDQDLSPLRTLPEYARIRAQMRSARPHGDEG